jgi:hypothetical protein
MSALRHIAGLLVLGTAAFTGCCLVDEDLGDCGDELTVDYELQLVTNMRTEIQTVFDLQTDLQVATALQDHFGTVFTDFARDADLSFYDTADPMARLEHMQVVMNDNQASYTLYLPGRDYMHLCSANVASEPSVTLEDADNCKTARLVQHTEVKDTVSAHTTGLFTARKEMGVITDTDQHFDVNLYMVNAATALVLDLEDAPAVKDIKVFLRGFADGFRLADSTYTFTSDLIVRTNPLPAEPGSTGRIFASCHFPSRDVDPGSKSIIETEEPFISEYSETARWEWQVYATLDDGSVTKTILHVHKSLRAGQLIAAKGKVHAKGEVSTDDQTVGVSVMLDWQPGQEHEIEL